MGATCTKIKREKVIQPIKATIEDPTQPESLSADGRRRLEIDHKKSSKVRKDSDGSINAGCPPYQPSAGNYIASTDDCLEDTPKPYAIHYITHTAHEDVSQFFGDALTKKSAYYQKGPLIGEGPSGEVYECLNLNTGELVAVKEIKLHGESVKLQPYLDAIRKENGLFRTLNHPNIMRYYDIEISEVQNQNQFTVGLAVEYVSGGSVEALLDKFRSLDEKVVMSYTRQILEGLSYLHKLGIVHKNLKGSNILIDANGTIKLADFGSFKFESFSEESPRESSNLSASMQNSIYWLAPEVVMKRAQGKAADVWSVGCLAIEMLTGLPPWKSLEKSLDQTRTLITSGNPPPFPQDISENCRDFLYKVLKFKPEDRPTVAELLAHPFVKHMSPNNSLLESDTFHSSLYGYGRPTEIFRSNSSIKANDSRLQVLATNLTTSNIYPSRVMNIMVNGIMKNYTTDLLPLSSSDIQDSEINPSMRPSLRKVQEVSLEDEYTPSITQKQFFPRSSKLTLTLRPPEKELSLEELEKQKAEKRRQIEEEMMRELAHTSIDQTKEVHENDLENSQENIQLEDEQQGEFGNNLLKVVPMQNAFFGQSMSKDFKGMETSRSKDIETSHIDASKTLEDEIERRFAEIRPNTQTNFWAWNKENEEHGEDKINNFSTKDLIRASANNFEEEQHKEPEEHVLRPRMINRPARPNMNRTAKPKTETAKPQTEEELLNEDITNIVDVSDFEGGIHKRDLPVRVESARLKGEELLDENNNGEQEAAKSRAETEENKEESLEYAKQELNTLVVN